MLANGNTICKLGKSQIPLCICDKKSMWPLNS
jgi:hypothetical protein